MLEHTEVCVVRRGTGVYNCRAAGNMTVNYEFGSVSCRVFKPYAEVIENQLSACIYIIFMKCMSIIMIFFAILSLCNFVLLCNCHSGRRI